MTDIATTNKTWQSSPWLEPTSDRRTPERESRWCSIVPAARRLCLTNDDGTPTVWWAFLAIVAPSLVVLSIIAAAIFSN
jgi:hypothetical protein